MSGPKKPLYFDNHATTPVDPRVLTKMLPFFSEDFGNAESSQHAFGWTAKSAIDRARKQVSELIGASEKSSNHEIIFTSGATESIHLAILGFIEGLGPLMHSGRHHIITASAEHKATLEVCARAAQLNCEVTVLPVNSYGQVQLIDVEKAIQPNTVLVSLMHGNNEIGTLHPIAEIGSLLAGLKIVFHVDAAQTVGREPIDVNKMNISLLSLSAHKLYGPKGTGALFIKRDPHVHLKPIQLGGGQERGLRGGTVNVPGIVGLGEACEIARLELHQERNRLQKLRDGLITEVMKNVTGVTLNGHLTERLCNNINFTIDGIDSDSLLLGLNDIAYSSASACSANTGSHVLKAIGRDTSSPLTTSLRFGLGRFTTAEEVKYLTDKFCRIVNESRKKSAPNKVSFA